MNLQNLVALISNNLGNELGTPLHLKLKTADADFVYMSGTVRTNESVLSTFAISTTIDVKFDFDLEAYGEDDVNKMTITVNEEFKSTVTPNKRSAEFIAFINTEVGEWITAEEYANAQL